MTAKNPALAKRGDRVEGGGTGEPEEKAGSEADRTETPGGSAGERSVSENNDAEVGASPPSGATDVGARHDGREDGAGHDGRPPVFEEILNLVKVIEQRSGQAKGPGGGLDKAAFEKLVKSVEELGAKGTVAKALRKGLGRRNREFGKAMESAAKLTGELRGYRSDLGRWVEQDRRRRRRWTGLAVAVGFPAALFLGLLVEQQYQVIPLHDPSGGWRGWIWETHGRAIVDCAVEATRTDAEVNCPLVVRRP